MNHSVIIPTVGRYVPLQKCLESILRQQVQLSEIVIVACANYLEVEEAVSSFLGKANINVIKTNVRNVAYQKNIGVKKCTGDVVHFLDDDVVLEPDYMRRIEEAYISNSQIMGVGGKINDAEEIKQWGPILRFCKWLFLLNSDNGNGSFLPSSFPSMQYKRKITSLSPTRLLMGCCSYKRNVFDVFQFDEELGLTHLWEDVDFAGMVSNKYLLAYQPNAVIIHYHSPGGRAGIEVYAYRYLYNHHYLAMKHGQRGLKYNLAFCWAHLGAILAMVYQATRNGIKLRNILYIMVTAEKDWVKGRKWGKNIGVKQS
ncbi:hypothetical protein SY88_11490 [Clostridiales bacterium PH28_bin88]|nr:hypothetical protein SY88_11490 [Clostridiales bacterium PH28_bin88]